VTFSLLIYYYVWQIVEKDKEILMDEKKKLVQLL